MAPKGGARAKAALGSIIFLVVVPGTVAGLIPWVLTGWKSSDPPVAVGVVGALLIAAGLGVLLHAFARFVIEGIGTPAPVAPTQSLVVGGLYRHVRNPMYIAVAAVIVGQALLLGRPELLVYALVFMAAVATFVRLYEEPVLSRRFGDQYAHYRRAVPAWRPRLRPLVSGSLGGTRDDRAQGRNARGMAPRPRGAAPPGEGADPPRR